MHDKDLGSTLFVSGETYAACLRSRKIYGARESEGKGKDIGERCKK